MNAIAVNWYWKGLDCPKLVLAWFGMCGMLNAAAVSIYMCEQIHQEAMLKDVYAIFHVVLYFFFYLHIIVFSFSFLRFV